MIATALLWLAIAGLAGSTVFLVLALLAAWRFRHRPVPAPAPGFLPPVSILKPVHGPEPRLRENLESFFRQDYPAFELIFGARRADDPALAVVETLRAAYPRVPVKIVLSGEPDQPNAKVCALARMVPAASHEILVITDSDVRVEPGYLRAVVPPLADPAVGLVTCVYRGVPIQGLWSRLEALGMSVEMTSGVLVADMLEGMKFALGPTMVIRRGLLAQLGGIGALASYCSDDYLLGLWVAAAGKQVVLSSHVIDHVVVNRHFWPSLLHQARWMKSTRFSRTWGHIGTGLTFAVPFGLLGFAAAMLRHQPRLAWWLLVAALANRVLQALAVGWATLRDRDSLRLCWLYPLRDLLGFFFWCFSFFGSTILWRGERYRLLPGGLMVRASAVALDTRRPRPVLPVDPR